MKVNVAIAREKLMMKLGTDATLFRLICKVCQCQRLLIVGIKSYKFRRNSLKLSGGT